MSVKHQSSFSIIWHQIMLKMHLQSHDGQRCSIRRTDLYSVDRSVPESRTGERYISFYSKESIKITYIGYFYVEKICSNILATEKKNTWTQNGKNMILKLDKCYKPTLFIEYLHCMCRLEVLYSHIN